MGFNSFLASPDWADINNPDTSAVGFVHGCLLVKMSPPLLMPLPMNWLVASTCSLARLIFRMEHLISLMVRKLPTSRSGTCLNCSKVWKA